MRTCLLYTSEILDDHYYFWHYRSFNDAMEAAGRGFPGSYSCLLYTSLNVIPLQIAPLRERKEDIIDLTEFFSRRYSRLFGKTLKGIDSQALEALQNHRWTGNVRELENTIEFMVNMIGEDGILTVKTLPRGFLKDDHCLLYTSGSS